MCVKKRPLGRTEMSLSWGTGASKHTATALPRVLLSHPAFLPLLAVWLEPETQAM